MTHLLVDTQGFKVIAVRADRTGKGYIVFDKPLESSPATCGVTHNNQLAFDANTEGEKIIMSVGFSALATGKTVDAYGTETCDIYSVVESWDYGSIEN